MELVASFAAPLAQTFSGVSTEITVLLVFVGVLIGGGLALGIRLWINRIKQEGLRKELDVMRSAAEVEAQKIVAQGEADAKSEFLRRREEFDAETAKARQELRDEERRLAKREDLIDEKLESFHNKEKVLETSERALAEREKALADKDRQLSELVEKQQDELHRVSQMSQAEAERVVLSKVEKDMERECAELIQRRIDEAKDSAETEARELVVQAIQRYAAEFTCDSTVSTVDIPSDDMKGRVIGREGRNIRAFEKATGIDVIVDDTPGVVVVSGFDPVRREVARRALEKLIQDGRIHPTRIEEVVSSCEKEVQKQIVEKGKQAAMEVKVRGLHPKLVELLGRLQFRTSYGQNVLQHSIEVAFLSQVISDQMGLDPQVARRAGLLHDIGKSVDHEIEGSHPQIGADLCKRYNEKPEIINAVAGHHHDIEAASIYTPIIASADAVSASRPGARRETLERYVQRLQKLEEIASSFDGVRQSYAIQAGREVRVIVDPDNVDDRLSAKIARDIALRIEDEMEYPGEVRVTLVRELRHVEYAR